MAADWLSQGPYFVRRPNWNGCSLMPSFTGLFMLHMNFFRNPQIMHATDNILGYGIFFSSFLVMSRQWKRGAGERDALARLEVWMKSEGIVLLNVHRNEKFIRDGGKGMKESVKAQSQTPTRKTKMPWSAAITTKLRLCPFHSVIAQELECTTQLLFQVLGWPGSVMSQ